MKTYKDLVFKPHALAKELETLLNIDGAFIYIGDNRNAKHAVLCFENGYGISVVKDCPLITGRSKYECAVLKGTEDKYELIYPDFAEDVVRCNTEKEIDELMKQIQKIKNSKKD